MDDNDELNNYIVTLLNNTQELGNLELIEDFTKVAEWLNELHMRRTGSQSKAMTEFLRFEELKHQL